MEKYIVYQTTNLINAHFYIGVHKTQNPNIFDGYLANGIWINKPHTYEKGKTKMQQAVKKYGVKNFKRTVLQIYDTAEEAYYMESLLVDEEFLKRPDVYNMVVGGEMQQYAPLITYKYTLQGEYIEEYPSIKEAAFNIKVRSNTLCQAILFKRSSGGFYWTTTKFDKLNVEEYNIPIKTLKVYIYNLDGTFYKEYDSCNIAAKDIGVAGVERAARLGYILNKKYYASFIKDEFYENARTTYLKTTPVYKYDSNGVFLEEYPNFEVAEKLNKGTKVNKFLKNKKPDKNGYLWSLEKLEYFNAENKTRSRKVGMFDDSGNLLKTWNSGKQCSLEYGRGVYHCLKGEYEKHKNYIFKYID